MAEVVIQTQEYGKDLVRLFKMEKVPNGNETVYNIFDFTLTVLLQGKELETCYRSEDNSAVIATDTMKNTVYILAYKNVFTSKAQFANILATHFLNYPQVEKVNIKVIQHHWERMSHPNGQEHKHPFSFLSRQEESFVTLEKAKNGQQKFGGGFRNIRVLKGTQSAFKGFHKDYYANLEEVDDRIFSTKVNTDFTFLPYNNAVDYNALEEEMTKIIFDIFANTFSPSVQYTLYLMGQKVLAQLPQVDTISFAMPNIHHFHVNLAPFKLDNNGPLRTVYSPINQPSGLITATIARKSSRL